MPRSKMPKEYFWDVEFSPRESGSVFDMLRYDGAKVISFSVVADGNYRLRLVSDRVPTIGRWRSFGIVPTYHSNPWPEDIFRQDYGDPWFATSRY